MSRDFEELDYAKTRLGELIGSAMKLLGFNTNCAPTLDLDSPCQQNLTVFGSDPRQVVRCGNAFWKLVSRARKGKSAVPTKSSPFI